MKKILMALGTSVAIGLAVNTKELSAKQDEANVSLPAQEIMEQTVSKTIKVCERQNFEATTGEMAKYTSEFESWLNSCDPEIRDIVRKSSNYRMRQPKDGPSFDDNSKMRFNVKYAEFDILTRTTLKATETFQSFYELNTENQQTLKNSNIWMTKIHDGYYSDFESLFKIIKIYKILEENPDFKNKLSGETKTISKDQFHLYRVYEKGKSAEVRIPVFSEILENQTNLDAALAVLQDTQ